MISRPWFGGGLDGRHVLAVLAGFFGVVFVVNGIFAYKALTTNTGLDTTDSYRKGLQYNARIAASESQMRLGWVPRIRVSDDLARIDVVVEDRVAAPVGGLKITGLIGRPATDRFDHKLVLTEVRPGVYETAIGALEAGNWAIALDLFRNSADPVYQLRQRLWLKPRH